MKYGKFLFIFLLFPACALASWYPHKSTSELRFVSAHKGEIKEENLKKLSRWEVSGRLLHATVKNGHQLGGIFQLGSEVSESKLGLHYTYSVNELLDLTVAGDAKDAFKNFGGAFWVNLNINYKGFHIKPFFNVDHKQFSEVGIVAYFKLQGVECNVGFAYAPKIGPRKEEVLTLMFGTSFLDNDNGLLGRYFKQDKNS